MSGRGGAVSVGIGPGGSAAAVRFAVDEAARSHVPVHLVHVLDVSPADPLPLSYDTVEANGRELLRVAAELAAECEPQVSVTTELVGEGSRARLLVERGAPCSYLVVAHRRRARWRRLFSGSVANGVASRSLVPVVVVPDDWTSQVDRAPVVTVAVQDPDELPGLLDTARHLAGGRSAEVVLLHAWWMDNDFDPALDEHQVDLRTAVLRSSLERAVTAASPGGPVTIQIEHRPVGDAVIAAAARSLLLVMGRRHHRLPLGTHLGPIARGAIDHADCPVVLAGPRPEDPVRAD